MGKWRRCYGGRKSRPGPWESSPEHEEAGCELGEARGATPVPESGSTAFEPEKETTADSMRRSLPGKSAAVGRMSRGRRSF